MFQSYRQYSLTQGVKTKALAVFSTASETIVLLHQTPVVHAKRRGQKYSIQLRNGGWDTLSTRIVINRALSQIPGADRYYISRDKGETIVRDVSNGESFPFVSGMRLKAGVQ